MSTMSVQRKDFIVPRCTSACPAQVDVPRYIRAVKEGRYDQAVAVLRESIPLPVVCADACFAPCEDICAYKQFGDPIAIRALKRAAVDKGGDAWKKNQKKAAPTGKKVAVVGAGPAGLTAAFYLATLGHAVTVFDAFPQPGGMMRYGIPKYRLPEERLERDLKDILAAGVKFSGSTVLGKDISLAQLKKDYDAVFLATGANSSTRISLEGSDKRGVLWGWEFLRDVALGLKFDLGQRVAVVGGGNVALDVALTARRLGAAKVALFCLEKRNEMPAHPWEVALAEEEGVILNNSWGPKAVTGDAKVSGILLKKCTRVFDKKGRFDPQYDEDITARFEADTVILAIGQAPVLDFLKGSKVKTGGNRIAAGQEDLATAEAGVFAGGDVVTGPASIIGGIAQGKKAAAAMDRFLGGRGDITEILAEPEEEVKLPEFTCAIKPRAQMPHLKEWERTKNFDQIERGMDAGQVAAEAARCLNCDARAFEVVLNTESCKECGYCTEVCGVETFGPAEGFNVKGFRPMEVKDSKWCVGCLKCFYACPDFAIGIRAKTA